MKTLLSIVAISIVSASFGLAQDGPQESNRFAVKSASIRTQFVQGTGHIKASKETYAAMILPLSEPVAGVDRMVIFFQNNDYGTAPYVDLPNKRFVIISTFDRFAAYSSLRDSRNDVVHGEWSTENGIVTAITFHQGGSGGDTPHRFEPNPFGLTPVSVAGPDRSPPTPAGLLSAPERITKP